MTTAVIDLAGPAFFDKVYGCWMGKNCGGTLGTPLEKAYGEAEPFDVWWYPKLQEGGIPNDDLEMQLIWLRALEEVGPGLKARDLAEYWLNHIGYNWDEYGWSRMNLRLGLLPPMSGHYNNWFLDCMGCPIRSEIFACVAPGLPRLAVRYAYEDAICDHAGGESVYGEMFNCSMEAAAFVVGDLNELLDIGRSYVADGSKTAAAIDAARAAHRAGLDWKGARQKVLEATPHYNAQYSPINMGFQAIGLLYGKDFGETLCIAVNCGYDTDCTGATVGSILGIIEGRGGLPAKWTEPLGDAIATNESWGGLRDCDKGGTIPRNLEELTRRTVAQAQRFSGGHTVSRDALYADESVRALWKMPATRVMVPTGTFTVGLDYLDSPAVTAHESKRIDTVLTNSAPVELEARCNWSVPEGWDAIPAQRVVVPALGAATVQWSIPIPSAARLENSNPLYFQVESPLRAAQSSAPLTLIGGRRMRISEPFMLPGASREQLLAHAFAPESSRQDRNVADGRAALHRIHVAAGNDLGLKGIVPANGVVYVQAFFHCATARRVIVGVPTTGSVKAWVNDEVALNLPVVEPFRPHTHKTEVYVEVMFAAGFNEVLLKFIGAVEGAFEAHLVLLDPTDNNAGIVDAGWTRFPWE